MAHYYYRSKYVELLAAAVDYAKKTDGMTVLWAGEELKGRLATSVLEGKQLHYDSDQLTLTIECVPSEGVAHIFIL
jgi:hypothetical protein